MATNEEIMKETLQWIAGEGQITQDAYYKPSTVTWFLRGLPTGFRQLRQVARECLRQVEENDN